MLDALIHYSIRNKLVVGMFTLALICWGTYALTQLPIDAVPDITNNQVQIITSAPAQAAQDIERLVTFPIEQSVATIPNITEVRSFSRFGLSVVTVVFEDDVDVYKARQLVSERLSAVMNQIPKGAGTPELAPVTTGLGEIYQYTIHAKPGFEKKYDLAALRTMQDWIVRRQLLGVKGVADVSSFGGFVKNYEIALDPAQLKSMQISIDDIFSALEKNNENTGGAYIDKEPYAWYIRSEGLLANKEQIEQIAIKTQDNGTPVFMRDVATIKFGHAIRYGAMTYNDKGEAAGAIVMMLKGANSSEVITNIKRRIEQIQKSLPEGVVIEPFLDRTNLVDRAIGTVTKNLLEGALIVIFILVLFLGNLRAGLIVASVIPLAMLFAIALMHVFGVSGNLMSLGAIDFGLIVDGAVIIVEASLHHLRTRTKNELLTPLEMDDEVYYSAKKIRSSAAFGELIILIVYLPILTLVGVEGKMFKPMAQTVVFAILGAFLLSLTYVPMMSALFLSRKKSTALNFSDRLMLGLQGFYKPILAHVLKRPLVYIASTVILFVGSIVLLNRLGAEFLPSLDEGDFAVEMRVMSGSSLELTIDAADKASRVLRKNFPDEVTQVVGKIGSSEIPTDPMPIEACDLMVILKDKSVWKKANTKEELASLMAKALEEIPGVTFGFQQPIQMRFNELMTGAKQDIVIKIYGEDLDMLTTYANDVAALIPSIKGATDLYREEITGSRQIRIDYKREELAKYNLSIDLVNKAINIAFAGQSAGFIYEGEKRFDVVVRFDKTNRQSIDDVRSLVISNTNGQPVPLEQVASVYFDDHSPIQIQRDDAKRRITVGFNVRGRDIESVVNELKKKIDEKIKFEVGYYPTYGGTFEQLQTAKNRLFIAVPAALILILVLLYFTFKSIQQSLLIFSAIPLAAIGGVFALWLRDMPFSISAGIGFIALFGVAVLNGIVLIAEFNHLKQGGVTDLRERITQGTRTRLRPVIMTAAVASLGFIPMAFSHGSGAEVQKPLATVVIGGLITATLLTLLILPCIYLLAEKQKINVMKNKKTTIALLVFLLMTYSNKLMAQTQRVSLDSALQLAYRNNKQLVKVEKEVSYFDEQRKAASEIPKTEFSLTYGQYNSYYKQDNNITINQSLPLAVLLGTKKELVTAQMLAAHCKQEITKNELTKQIRQVYYQLIFWSNYRLLVVKQDSLFQQLARTTSMRFKTGDVSLLEKTSADAQAGEWQEKLKQVDLEVGNLNIQLQFLLGVSYPVSIWENNAIIREFHLPTDSLAFAQNPQLTYFKQQITIAEKEKQVVAQSALPDITLGYFNQSLYGGPLDASNMNFATTGNRFQGVQVGLAIPLWFYPQTQAAQAAKTQIEMAELAYSSEQSLQQSYYQQAWRKYEMAKSHFEYYQKTALPNALLIEQQSKVAYEKGELSFSQHAQNMQQAIHIQEAYWDTWYAYNLTIIELEFLTAQ